MAASDGTSVQFSSTWANFVGGFLAISVTLVVAAQTIIPYFLTIPESSSATIGQQQTMFQTVFIMIVSFFFANTAANRMKDAAIATQASTIATAQAALTPQTTTTSTTTTSTAPATNATVATVVTPTTTVPLHAGQTATVKADAVPPPPAPTPPKPLGS